MNMYIYSLLHVTGLVAVIGALGLFRFKHLFSRIHAATVISVGGVYLTILLLAADSWFGVYTLKALFALFILAIADPVITHAIAEKSLVLDKPHGKLVRNDMGTDKGLEAKR